MQVLKQPWPGMLRTVYGNHARFESVYFKKFPGYYYTGDGTITICLTKDYYVFSPLAQCYDSGNF